MFASKVNGRASDTNGEKSVPSAVVNHPFDAITAKEGTNSFTLNSAGNTGHSNSPPFPPAKSNQVPGANDSLINATPPGPALPPHAADGLHYPPGHLLGVDGNSCAVLIQNPSDASTSKHPGYACALIRDSRQCFGDPSSTASAQSPLRSTSRALNDLPTSPDPAPSSSTGLAQAFDLDNTDKQISQRSSCLEASGISPRPSVGGSGDPFGKWTWLAQDPSSSTPQPRSTPLPRSSLGPDPLPQCIPATNSQTPESIFVDDLSPSEWSPVGFPEDLQLQDPKRADSSYETEESVSPNSFRTTSPDCVCHDGPWLRHCPRLWDHVQSAFASTPTISTCTDGAHNDVVPRNCPAAASHLLRMVQENFRMVADRYQNAAQGNLFHNHSHYVDPLVFAPSRRIGNPYREPINPSSTAIEGQKIPSSDIQLSSSTGQPSADLPVQRQNHALSVNSNPSVSMNPEHCQTKPTRRRDPNAEISSRTALPSSEARLTPPTLSDLPFPNNSRKRSVSDDPAVSNVTKKQKTEPLPQSFEDLFYHKSGPKLQIRRRSDWLGMPSTGGQKHKRGKGKKQGKRKGKGVGKRKGKGVSNGQPKQIIGATLPRLPYMDEVDRAFLDGALKTLKSAPFLNSPQQIECTVGKDGACELDVVRLPCSTRIGQVQEGDSVYFIFLSQIEDKFLCWICGHTMTFEKQLRALGHVRMHFEHRPFHCNWRIIPEKGEEFPCGCGKSWTSKEAMRDEHKKRFTQYECTYCLAPTSCSTPSNLARHIREMHPEDDGGSTT